jgi:hypothetical protein
MFAPGAGDALLDAAGVSMPDPVELFNPRNIFHTRTLEFTSIPTKFLAVLSHVINVVDRLASVRTGIWASF